MDNSCRNCGNYTCPRMGSIDTFLICSDWILDRTDEELEELNREQQIIDDNNAEV